MPQEGFVWDFSCPQVIPANTPLLVADKMGNILPCSLSSCSPIYQQQNHCMVPAPGHSFVFMKTRVEPTPPQIPMQSVYFNKQEMPGKFPMAMAIESGDMPQNGNVFAMAAQNVTCTGGVVNPQRHPMMQQPQNMYSNPAPCPSTMYTGAVAQACFAEQTVYTSHEPVDFSGNYSSMETIRASFNSSFHFSTNDSMSYDASKNSGPPPQDREARSAKKHDKIGELLEFLHELFENRYNNDKKADGENVIRVDIKSITGLDTIQDHLDTIETVLDVVAVSTRASLKKNKQRKGVSIYIKVAKANQIRKMQSVLRLVPNNSKKPMWIFKVSETA